MSDNIIQLNEAAIKGEFDNSNVKTSGLPLFTAIRCAAYIRSTCFSRPGTENRPYNPGLSYRSNKKMSMSFIMPASSVSNTTVLIQMTFNHILYQEQQIHQFFV